MNPTPGSGVPRLPRDPRSESWRPPAWALPVVHGSCESAGSPSRAEGGTRGSAEAVWAVQGMAWLLRVYLESPRPEIKVGP